MDEYLEKENQLIDHMIESKNVGQLEIMGYVYNKLEIYDKMLKCLIAVGTIEEYRYRYTSKTIIKYYSKIGDIQNCIKYYKLWMNNEIGEVTISWIHCELGKLYEQSGDDACAIDNYDCAIELYDNTHAMILKGTFYRKRGDLENMQKYYEMADLYGSDWAESLLNFLNSNNESELGELSGESSSEQTEGEYSDYEDYEDLPEPEYDEYFDQIEGQQLEGF